MGTEKDDSCDPDVIADLKNALDRAWASLSLDQQIQASPIDLTDRIVETVALAKTALELSWASLSPHQRVHMSRTILSERILEAVVEGERDPSRLRERALFGTLKFCRKQAS